MRIAVKQTRAMPALQIHLSQIAAAVDRFIRERLFGEPFDPFCGYDPKFLCWGIYKPTEYTERTE